MKKKMWAVLSAILCILFLSSCGMGALVRRAAQEVRAGQAEASSVTDAQGNTLETRFFGTYTVPAGWSEAEGLSTGEKWFYLRDGTDPSSPTSNISVEYGTNRYPAGQHEAFREAIVSQLAQQSGITALNGTGTYTGSGDILYIFTIENNDGTTTIQYYIVGEKKYVLVHATDFHDKSVPDLEDTANRIAYGFEWT